MTGLSKSRISRLALRLAVIDLLLTPAGLIIASFLRRTLPIGRGGALADRYTAIPWPVYIFGVLSWMVALVANGAYDPRRVLRWYDEALRVIWSAVIAMGLMAGLLYLSFRQFSRLQFIYFFAVNLALLLGHRALLRILYRISGRSRPGWGVKVMIAGAGDLGRMVARVILDRSRWGYKLIGFVDDDPRKRGYIVNGSEVLGSLEDANELVGEYRVDEIWVALPPRSYERLEQLVANLHASDVRIKVVPDYFSLAFIQARADIVGGIPVIGLREPVIQGRRRLAKRTFDVLVSGILLLVTSPFMLLVAMAIRLDSPGPAVFRQERAGEDGRLFEMYKFRTMVKGAENDRVGASGAGKQGEMIHKLPDDPRVTRIGRFLRRYSLDELPQLFNVLKGNMSLVGPRPELPWLVEKYQPWQRKRFAVPQGITGWWQINGRSDRPMHLNTQDDLYYVYNYSLWLDIYILLRTPLAVLSGRGAF